MGPLASEDGAKVARRSHKPKMTGGSTQPRYFWEIVKIGENVNPTILCL